jgi:hypothetical protein
VARGVVIIATVFIGIVVIAVVIFSDDTGNATSVPSTISIERGCCSGGSGGCIRGTFGSGLY